MRLHYKNILLVSPEPWKHIFVSKHHYASHLAKRGNTVYFLNPPSKQYNVRKTTFKRVFSVNYTGFIKGLRYFPPFLQIRIIRKIYNQLENLCQVKFDIVWSFDNSVFYDFSALPDDILKISHIVDLNQNFQVAKAAKTADICFGVCKPIIDKLKVHNTRSYFIPHGYNHSEGNKAFHLDKCDTIKVGYAGNLDLKYIDWISIKQSIRQNRNIQFYFAGPFTLKNPHIDWLIAQSNVKLMGKIGPGNILNFYRQVDLLLLCYRSKEFPDQLSNSHKMMEYLGSGKMICASSTAEYKLLQKEGLIAMCQEKQNFPALFKHVLLNLEQWNSQEKQTARKDFARENTYTRQIDRIEALVRKTKATCFQDKNA